MIFLITQIIFVAIFTDGNGSNGPFYKELFQKEVGE